MNIQQLEYIIALDDFRHFAKAAEICEISQPTLSMMIQKLEDELSIRIFDRSKFPVEPTPIGKQVINQARISLMNIRQIKEVVNSELQTVMGTFKLGVIPTVAPYLVPELLHQKQNSEYKDIKLILKEKTTDKVIESILTGTLDGGVVAGPLNHPKIVEYPIYYEKFLAYVSPNDKMYQEKEIDLKQINLKHLWLLENVHCLRGQVERLCNLKKKSQSADASVKFESGSIETLMNVVDYNSGMTIITELSAIGLSEERQANLRKFKDVTAVREVSLVVSQEFVHKTMLNIIINIIKQSVPKSMQDPDLKKYAVDL